MLFSLLIYMLFASWLQAKPQLTFSATGQIAYAEAVEDMSDYFFTGKGARIDLFGGVKLPMVKYVNAAGLGLDFTWLEFQGRKSTSDWYRSFQWDWFKLPLPKLILGPLELHADIGLFWNIIDVDINEYDYHQTSIRPGFSSSIGLAINIGPNIALVADARYNTMFEDKEKLAMNTIKKISMNYPVYYIGLRGRI